MDDPRRQKRSPRRLLLPLAALSLSLFAACGGGPSAPPDGGPVPMFATVDNAVAWEGQAAFVTLVHAPVDVDGATVTLPSELSLVESRCAGRECAIVARVLDTTGDTGTPIPPPIEALIRTITIATAAGEVRATVNVMPLDAIRNSGATAMVGGTYFAASLTATGASVFRGRPGGAPVRWLVFGDAALAGTVDVSAMDALGGPGGGDGGGAGAAATGMGAGGLESGGGSSAAGAGASGGAAWAPGCAADFFAAACGGGGGGGDASGEGGGGGGAFALVALGALDFDGDVRATGGPGGGGGGGGRVFVSAGEPVSPPSAIDVAGGTGRVADGGAGEATVEVEVDLPASYLVPGGALVLTGRAPDGATIRAETVAGVALGSAMAAGGAFSLSLALPAGFSRVRLFVTEPGGTERRVFVGNHVELMGSGAFLQPVGGLLDVVASP